MALLRKLRIDSRILIPTLTVIAFPILIKLTHKFGLPFLAILSMGLFVSLVLIQISSEKSIPYLIGFAILPFDSIYSGIPLLSRFHSSAPFVVILAGAFLLIGKSGFDKPTYTKQITLTSFLLLIFAVAALVSRFQQIPRNVIFLLAVVSYLAILRSYLSKSRFSPKALATPFATATGVYSILMLLFKNPISLIVQGNYVSKLNSNANPGRLTGFGDDYEVLGLTLAVGAIACFYLITVPNPLNRVFFSVLFVAISISLLATASVTSLLLAFFGILFVELNGNKQLGVKATRGRTIRLLLIGLFILLGSQVAIQRFSQRGIHGTNFIGNVSPLRLLNRGNVWATVMNSNTWNKHALFGQGWPYPYEQFGTWPHNTLLGVWISGGLSLLVVGTIVVLKFGTLIFYRIKKPEALISILATSIILGSITIDLYRTSSLIFLTMTILFTLYWEPRISQPNSEVKMGAAATTRDKSITASARND